ncbi:MAG TPA: hypothetical protein PL180_05540 [Spirochaetota bacterium]|nr:hypothetical protein [Spirochaetota bacterium]
MFHIEPKCQIYHFIENPPPLLRGAFRNGKIIYDMKIIIAGIFRGPLALIFQAQAICLFQGAHTIIGEGRRACKLLGHLDALGYSKVFFCDSLHYLVSFNK